MKDGFVSLSMLFILFFVVLLTLSLNLYVQRSVSLMSEESLALRLKNDADNQIWHARRTPLLSRKCQLQDTVTSSKSSINRSALALCSSYSKLPLGAGLITAEDMNYPLFNYAKLFKEYSSCDMQDDEAPAWLNSSALHSSFTCHYTLGDIVAKQKAFAGNLQAGNIAFLGSGLGSSNSLAVKGYIDIDNMLVSLPTLIVAAGDVKIKRFVVVADILPVITIVSATGSVNIDELVGEANFYIISYLQPDLPININLIKSLKTPENITVLPIALRK